MSDPLNDGLSPSETISRAARIQSFLSDDAITAALGKLERKYYEEFKQAATDADRLRAQSRAIVLADFLTEMQVILSAGERETLRVYDEQKHTQQRARPNP